MRHRAREPRVRGFTYVGVLLAVALLGIGLTLVSEVWSKVAERQREAEMAWVGQQYLKALTSYYNASPGSVRTLPVSLDELLQDRRHLGVVRHLRRIYLSPCGGGTEVRPEFFSAGGQARVVVRCPGGREKSFAWREGI